MCQDMLLTHRKEYPGFVVPSHTWEFPYIEVLAHGFPEVNKEHVGNKGTPLRHGTVNEEWRWLERGLENPRRVREFPSNSRNGKKGHPGALVRGSKWTITSLQGLNCVHGHTKCKLWFEYRFNALFWGLCWNHLRGHCLTFLITVCLEMWKMVGLFTCVHAIRPNVGEKVQYGGKDGLGRRCLCLITN